MVERVIWFNGAFSNDEKCVSIRDRGFLLGDGAFETLLLRNGVPAFFDLHASRIEGALKILGINIVSVKAWRSAIQELWRRNGYSHGYGVARITVTRGTSRRGLSTAHSDPTVLVTVEEIERGENVPCRLAIAKPIRFSGSTTNGYKSLSGYAENIVARNDAVDAGFDDAVLVNERGYVVCATAANIFVIRGDGAILTPALTEGACPGVTRALVIEIAQSSGMKVFEQSISVEMLSSNEIFLTNSLIGLKTAQFDGVPEQVRSPFFSILQSAYAERVEKEFS